MGLRTNIKIIGCGGGGSNTIDRLYASNIKDAELYAANTDAQHLLVIRAHKKILLGRRSTRGLGAGALPQVGEEAAREAEEELRKALQGADIVFITAGLGGGTGTGSAPFVAGWPRKWARSRSRRHLAFQGRGRDPGRECRMGPGADAEYRRYRYSDTERQADRARPQVPSTPPSRSPTRCWARAIRGITELITRPGLVNLDFNDLRTIMKGGGVAMIGLGRGRPRRPHRPCRSRGRSLAAPRCRDHWGERSINKRDRRGEHDGERGREGGRDHPTRSPNARIIWGAAVDPTMQDKGGGHGGHHRRQVKAHPRPQGIPFCKAMKVDFIK